MKKLLTIVALALVLCLGISFALAATVDWEDLNEEQVEKIMTILFKAGINDSSKVKFDGKGGWSQGDIKGKIPSCGDDEGDHPNFNTYYTHNEPGVKDPVKTAEKPSDADMAIYLHYGALKEVKECTVCGKKIEKTLAAQLPHTFGTETYYTYYKVENKVGGWTAAELADLEDDQGLFWMTKDEEKGFSCWADKGDSLYKTVLCEDCGAVNCTLVVEHAAGKHTYSQFKVVYEEPTCFSTGKKAYQCTVCGEWEPFIKGDLELFEPIPTLAHVYTEKIYEYEWDFAHDRDHTEVPSCVNGLTAVFTYECKYCGEMYEGDVALPDFDNYGHTEEWTASKAAKVLGWNKTVDTGIRVVSLYDEDGHYYSIPVNEETGETEYFCQQGYRWTFACQYCGKKITISNGEEEPDFDNGIIKEAKFSDCTHATLTIACGICEGKAGDAHIKKIEKEFELDDEAAHNFGKYLVEDLSLRVTETCVDDGQKVFVCSECGYVLTEVIPKNRTAHTYGEWTAKKDENGNVVKNVWIAKCIYCGDTIVKAQEKKPEDNYYKKTKSVEGTCLERAYDLYTLTDKNGKAVLNYAGDPITRKVYGDFGAHIPVEVESFHKDATCSQKGQVLWICARCTNYNPDTPNAKTLAECMTWRGVGRGTPWFELVETDMLPHTWDAGKAQADGSILYTCTVCKATKTAEGPTEIEGIVTFDDEDNVLEGYVEVKEGTIKPDVLFARVTFFFANGTYNVGSVQIAEDGTFEAQTGVDVVHVAVQIVNNNKVRPGEFESYDGTEFDVE